jgi:hypothetical protein
VGRLDVDAARDTRDTESNDAPIVARTAAAAGLPAIHPLAALGVIALAPPRCVGPDQVLLGRKELVVSGNDGSAQALGRQVD